MDESCENSSVKLKEPYEKNHVEINESYKNEWIM